MAIRAVLFKGTRDLLPIYALYGVLFADHGLGTAQISLLLALWSVTAFVLEVPSGAWADTVSRRVLLILSCVLQAVCFVLWMVAPSFLGFALGFVVWGVASSLESGTFEALIYDDLVARGETSSYARIMGWTRGAQESTVLLAILVAAPLFALGGYALVGWVSVGVAVLHTLTAFALPSAPVAISATAVDDLDDEPAMPGPHAVPGAAPVHAADPESARGLARYLTMLRTGTTEALGVRRVRRGVLLGALLYGLTSFDEYFGLLAVSGGASTSVSALLVGVTVAGSLLGSLLAGRAEAVPARGLAAALFAAGVLFIAGALAVGAMSPVFLWAGFVGIGVAYGIDFTVEVVAGARLQDAIEGPARATVTSFSGLLSEIVALAVFGVVAVATQWLSMSSTIALFGIVLLVAALLIPSWLPPRK